MWQMRSFFSLSRKSHTTCENSTWRNAFPLQLFGMFRCFFGQNKCDDTSTYRSFNDRWWIEEVQLPDIINEVEWRANWIELDKITWYLSSSSVSLLPLKLISTCFNVFSTQIIFKVQNIFYNIFTKMTMINKASSLNEVTVGYSCTCELVSYYLSTILYRLYLKFDIKNSSTKFSTLSCDLCGFHTM